MELGRRTKNLLKKEIIPAVLYGPGIKNANLSIDRKAFEKVFKETGKSSLVSLSVEGKKDEYSVLINDLKKDPVSGLITHIDFYQPNLSKEIEAEVPLVFEGESDAVKDSSGTLVKNITMVTVKALPGSLPREIKVNVDKLKTFEDSILIKDLVVGEGAKIQKNPEEIVALAIPQEKVEEELEKPIEEKVEEVEKVEKEKKEEEGEETETEESEKKG